MLRHIKDGIVSLILFKETSKSTVKVMNKTSKRIFIYIFKDRNNPNLTTLNGIVLDSSWIRGYKILEPDDSVDIKFSFYRVLGFVKHVKDVTSQELSLSLLLILKTDKAIIEILPDGTMFKVFPSLNISEMVENFVYKESDQMKWQKITMTGNLMKQLIVDINNDLGATTAITDTITNAISYMKFIPNMLKDFTSLPYVGPVIAVCILIMENCNEMSELDEQCSTLNGVVVESAFWLVKVQDFLSSLNPATLDLTVKKLEGFKCTLEKGSASLKVFSETLNTNGSVLKYCRKFLLAKPYNASLKECSQNVRDSLAELQRTVSSEVGMKNFKTLTEVVTSLQNAVNSLEENVSLDKISDIRSTFISEMSSLIMKNTARVESSIQNQSLKLDQALASLQFLQITMKDFNAMFTQEFDITKKVWNLISEKLGAKTFFRQPLLFNYMIAETAQRFVVGTRKPLFEKVSGWLENAENQLFVLYGRPGTGKSTFTAAVIQDFMQNHSEEFLGAFIFNDREMSSERDIVSSFIYSIAYQMASNAALNQSEDIHAAAKNLDSQKGWKALWDNLVRASFKNLNRTFPNRNFIIFIDALDESPTSYVFVDFLKSSVLPTLTLFSGKIFISCRSNTSVYDILKSYGEFSSYSLDQEQHGDVKLFVEERLGAINIPKTKTVIIEKCSENFLSLALVCNHIFRLTNLRNTTGDQLEQDCMEFLQGLQNAHDLQEEGSHYYPFYLTRLIDSESESNCLEYLSCVICGFEPLTLEEIAELTNLSLETVQNSFSKLEELFYAQVDQEGKKRIYPFHSSIVDWLFSNAAAKFKYSSGKRFKISRKDESGKMLKKLLGVFSSRLSLADTSSVLEYFKTNTFSSLPTDSILIGYLSRHLLHHLIEGEYWEMVYYIITSISWIRNKICFCGLEGLKKEFWECYYNRDFVNHLAKDMQTDLKYLNHLYRVITDDRKGISWENEICLQIVFRCRQDNSLVPESPLDIVVGGCKITDFNFFLRPVDCDASPRILESTSSFKLTSNSRINRLLADCNKFLINEQLPVLCCCSSMHPVTECNAGFLSLSNFSEPELVLIPSEHSFLVYNREMILIIDLAELKPKEKSISKGNNLGDIDVGFTKVVASENYIYAYEVCSSEEIIGHQIHRFDLELNLLSTVKVDFPLKNIVCLVADDLLCLPNEEFSAVYVLSDERNLEKQQVEHYFTCMKHLLVKDNKSVSLDQLLHIETILSTEFLRLNLKFRSICRTESNYFVEAIDTFLAQHLFWYKSDIHQMIKLTFNTCHLHEASLIMLPSRTAEFLLLHSSRKVIEKVSAKQNVSDSTVQLVSLSKYYDPHNTEILSFLYHEKSNTIITSNAEGGIHILDPKAISHFRMVYKSSSSKYFKVLKYLSRCDNLVQIKVSSQAQSHPERVESYKVNENIITPLLPSIPGHFVFLQQNGAWTKSTWTKELLSFQHMLSFYYVITSWKGKYYLLTSQDGGHSLICSKVSQKSESFYTINDTVILIADSKKRSHGTHRPNSSLPHLEFYDVTTGETQPFPRQGYFSNILMINDTTLLFSHSAFGDVYLLTIEEKKKQGEFKQRFSYTTWEKVKVSHTGLVETSNPFIKLADNLMVVSSSKTIRVIVFDPLERTLTLQEEFSTLFAFFAVYLPSIPLDLLMEFDSRFMDELFYCEEGIYRCMKVSQLSTFTITSSSRELGREEHRLEGYQFVVVTNSGKTHLIYIRGNLNPQPPFEAVSPNEKGVDQRPLLLTLGTFYNFFCILVLFGLAITLGYWIHSTYH